MSKLIKGAKIKSTVTYTSNDTRWHFYIPEASMNEALHDFMGSVRPFTAYGVDKLEVVARHYGLVPTNAHYAEFDSDTRELHFIVSILAHGNPKFIERKSFDIIKGIFKRLLRKT